MKALVVDDDAVLADLVAFTLRREGFQIVQAADGETALQRWAREQPDIIILDVNLPRSALAPDGFAVCRRIRESSDVPIILLTVRDEEEDIVKGLKLGADDYVLKPFSPRQLTARVQAVLRRTGKGTSVAVLQAAGLTFDPNRREVLSNGQSPVLLTPLEARLFEILLRNAGQIVPTEDLINRVWGSEGGDRDMLRQLVRRLRAKIEPDAAQPVYIETIPGLGYGFKKSTSSEE